MGGRSRNHIFGLRRLQRGNRVPIAAYEARSVSFTVPNTDTTLTLNFASIFDEFADWIIGVNEFFDSILGNIVSVSPLHGQIIAKLYTGNEANFRRDVDAALSGPAKRACPEGGGPNGKILTGDDGRKSSWSSSQDISRRDLEDRSAYTSLKLDRPNPMGCTERSLQRSGRPRQR